MRPGPPEPLPPAWPLADHAHTAQIAPYRWHLARLGTGPDMLMLHGAGASAHSWGGLAPLLADSFRLTLPDLPGHGWTRAHGMRRAGLEAMAADLARLVTELDAVPEVIIGHSAGGAVALELARQLRPEPRAVVILNGALENFQGLAGVMFPMMARLLALNPLAAPLLARSARNPQAVDRVIKATGSDLGSDALQAYRHLIQDRNHVAGTLAMMAAWRLDGLARALPEIALPVLFLHGAHDAAVAPDVARRAVEKMPQARLEVLEGLGHLIHEEAPDLVQTHIRTFLDGLA